MALHIQTTNSITPDALWNYILKQIKKGEIDTWETDADEDLTHIPYQWYREAWFRHYPDDNELIIGIIARRDKKMSKVIYGLYHGRFAEMLLIHFDTLIKEIKISSYPENGYDLI